jgi:ABC-type lipoprotein release transport system permease subunit
MIKLGYLIEISIKQIIRSFKLNKTLFLCFYLGMILPFYCFASFNSLTESLEMLKFDGMDRSVSATWTSEILNKNQRLELEKYIGSKSISYKISRDFCIAQLSNSSILVYGIDESKVNANEILLSDGKMINQNKKECVLGQEIANKYNYKINDYVKLKNTKYKVVGITDSRAYLNNLIIPIDLFQDTINNEGLTAQYYVLFTFNTQEESQKHEEGVLPWLIKEKIIAENFDIEQAIEYYNASKNSIQYWIEARIIVGISGLAFALINIMMVLVGKLQENKKSYGIKLALGIERKSLYISFLIENMIIALFADLLLFATMPSLAKILDMDKTMSIDTFVILGILILSIVVCAIISGILMLRLSKQSIITMLREEL